MARPSSSQLRSGPYFATLIGLILIGYLLVLFTGGGGGPKLGLDLQGGTTVTLQAKTQNGKAPSRDDLDTARNIIEDRVNGLGVANSDVVTQGNNQIVISVPGKNGSQAKTLGTTAQLFFRPALSTTPLGVSTPTASATASGTTAPTTTPSGSTPSSPAVGPSGSATAKPTAKPTTSPKATGSASPQGDRVPDVGAAPSAAATTAAPKATGTPTSTGSAVPTSSSSTVTATLPAGVPAALAPDALKSCGALAKKAATADPKKPIVACYGKSRIALGPSLFPGTEVKSAAAQFNVNNTNEWTIQINLKGGAQKIWADYTSKHNDPNGTTDNTAPAADYVAFVLDGRVLTMPVTTGTINGATQVSGSFTADSAKNLANSLKYGALPLTFTTSNAETVSATLGKGQLHAGLLAGGIGLALVVLYSLIYYRALGLVTVASLAVSGLMTYACVVLLGRQLGFTLTLAGIAGFIVAVGITADSFVVFFERLKEEVHGGRSMRSGVPRAWIRARRTILSADAVSFLAAAILYYLAAGEVRGFAFTLGLSTILDLIVVFLFTHPLVSVLSRSRTFSSPRFSGLKAVQSLSREPTRGAGPDPSESSRTEGAAARAAARRNAGRA